MLRNEIKLCSIVKKILMYFCLFFLDFRLGVGLKWKLCGCLNMCRVFSSVVFFFYNVSDIII